MITAEQVLAAHKANIETFFSLGFKAFEGVEKLVELNMQVAKANMTEVSEAAKAALSVKDPQELVALQSGLSQPAAEKVAAYGRHIYDIAAATGADMGRIAEAQMTGVQQKFMSMVDGAVANAPAGTENAVALVKSAVAAANNAYDTVSKAAKQATDVAEANFTAMTNTAVKAAAAAPRARKVV